MNSRCDNSWTHKTNKEILRPLGDILWYFLVMACTQTSVSWQTRGRDTTSKVIKRSLPSNCLCHCRFCCGKTVANKADKNIMNIENYQTLINEEDTAFLILSAPCEGYYRSFRGMSCNCIIKQLFYTGYSMLLAKQFCCGEGPIVYCIMAHTSVFQAFKQISPKVLFLNSKLWY